MIENECRIWEVGLSGIHYLPVSYNPRECLERTEIIEEQMTFIRSKYKNKKMKKKILE